MFPVMHENPELDEATADRLLAGVVTPDDAPPGYQAVARALHDAALVASTPSTQDAAAPVAAFLGATPTRRTARMRKWKIAAATLAGATLSMGGLAAADVLPDTAQDVASSALSTIGITVPSGDDSSTTVSTKKAAKVENKVEDDSPTTTRPENHGAVVSDVARDDSNVGADHGAAVCTTASDGKCKAGQTTRGRSDEAGTQRSETGSTNSSNSSSSNGASSNTGSSNSSTQSGSSANTGSSNASTTGSSNSSGSTGSSSTGSSSSGGTSSSSGSTSGS